MPEKRAVEQFFDTPEAFWYVRGVFSKGYCPVGDYGIQFESPSSQLVDIVAFHLGIENAASLNTGISGRTGKTLYQIRIENANHLNSGFGEVGLNTAEEGRRFPEISCQRDLCNFSRGVLDTLLSYLPEGAGILNKGEGGLQLDYNVPFIRKLYSSWADNGFVKDGKEVNRAPLLLSLEDRIGLRVSLYQNLKYLREHRLYLPATKRLLSVVSAVFYGKVTPKIIDIMDLLVERVPMHEIAKQIGYGNLTAMCRYVKNKTEKTATELLDDYRIQATGMLALQNVSVEGIWRELGFESYGGFCRFIERMTSKTPGQYLKSIRSA